jgi:uncharacterized OsmC-like protein
MAMQDVAAAMERVKTVLERRPEMGLHDDAPATARWEGGTRIVASHANGKQMATDMPSELGGSGDQVTPGWLFRAGLASCGATTIAMTAAKHGIELTTLEVKAGSRSDTRGVLRMEGADGTLVDASPSDLRVFVRIAASNASPEQLRALVAEGMGCAPITNAVANANPIAVDVEIA